MAARRKAASLLPGAVKTDVAILLHRYCCPSDPSAKSGAPISSGISGASGGGVAPPGGSALPSGPTGPGGRDRFETMELAIVLSHFEIGTIEAIQEFPKGSRKAPKLILRTNQGMYLLKRRARGKDDPFKVAFCHALQLFLASKQFPLPHLIGTKKDNNSMLHWKGGIYELFEYIKGASYDNSLEATADALASYRLPRWEGADPLRRVVGEKDALAGVLEPMAKEFHVTMMVNRGYSSQSAMYESATRFKNATDAGHENSVLFYLGDHDPSGEDMVRDVGARLELFGVQDLDVQKLAPTMAQIQVYKPFQNPKMSDSRAKA